MKRFLALLMALAMTFSIVMPSVAAAHSGAASGNASQVAVQSENADENSDKGKEKDKEEAPKEDSKSGDASKGDEKKKEGEKSGSDKEKADEKSGSDKDAGDKSDDSSGDKSGKGDDSSGDKAGDTSSKGESSQGAEPSDDGKKDKESPDDSSRDVDEDEQPDDSGEKSAREPEQGPVLRELRASLKCVDGVTYTVTVAYPEEAELPEGTELSLVELNQALTKKEQKLPENKHRPYKTEKFLSKDALEQVSFDLHSGLRVEEDDFVLFTKLLDLSLTHQGKAVQPKVPVLVTIETDVVSEGASDILEAAFYDAKATEKWQKDLKERRKKAKERLPDTIFTKVKLENETRKKKGVKLRFETEEFARLGLTGVAKPLKSWDCQGEMVRVYGPRHLKAEVRSANMETPEAGVEKLRAFTVKVTEKQRPDYDVKFWVGREQSSGGLSTQESADERVGVAARKLSDGKSKRDLFSAEDAGTPTAFREGDDIGLVWDTGFRDQTLEAEDVTLSGLLPKGARAEADDVSGQYSDPGNLKKDNAKKFTVAAYDIKIKDGEADYQPDADKSVQVSIHRDDFPDDGKLEVWHLLSDGSVEVVKGVSLKGSDLRFQATGFSVYLVVQITKEQVLTAGDGKQYQVTVTYDSDAGIPEDAELSVSELTEGRKYDKYVKKAAKKLGVSADSLAFARAFDIALVNPESGAHYQPAKPLKVSVKLLDEEPGSSVDVVHFGDKTEVLESSVSGKSVEFETDGFSVFLLAGYSVDFHWGTYTYSIAGESEILLSALLEELGVTELSLATVADVSFTNPALVDVKKVENKDGQTENWLLRSLAPFDTEETLTLTLKNGRRVEITVTDAGETYTVTWKNADGAVLETDENVAAGSTPSYDGETPVKTAENGLSYAFTGWSPEIANVTEDVTYTAQFGIALTITADSDSKVYDRTPLTKDSYTVTGLADGHHVDSVTITGEQTIPGSSNNVPSDAKIVDTNGADVTSQYVIRYVNGTLNVFLQVSASLSAVSYDAQHKTVDYTAVVTTEGIPGENPGQYTFGVADLTARSGSGMSFVSGSWTNNSNGQQTDGSFTGFPLNVDMHAGDTLTLTYKVEVADEAVVYNSETGNAEIRNAVTVAAAGETVAESSEATTAFSYVPLKREYLTLDGSWAYWQVTVNPESYTLNNGRSLTLMDTFDDSVIGDAEQFIDYGSIRVSVNDSPDTTGTVTYDFSGGTGTFVIPDNTYVKITYRTRITAQPGEKKLFRGTALLTDGNGKEIARSTSGVTDGDGVVIYPSPSEVAGFGTSYMVKLFVYADGQMQTGIPGATFILLDEDQRPMEYKHGDNAGQPVTFTTGADGYVDIMLNEEPGDVSIEKNTGYYLEMMQAVEGYQKDNTPYSFMITDDPSFNAGDYYKYYNGDTMKVRLYPAMAGLSVSIRFSGSYDLPDEQKNAVTVVLQKLDDEDNWVDVKRHSYTDAQRGSIRFSEPLYDSELLYQNTYRVIEENQTPWDLPESIHTDVTYYCLKNTAPSDPYADPPEFSVDAANDSVSVIIDNRYEEPQLTLVKMDKSSGSVLPGAVFSVFKIVNGVKSGSAVKTYTSDESGELVIRGGEPYESETLYGIVETTAPTDYLLPQEEEWHYFYFCNDAYLEPNILANLPRGAKAVNLTNSGDRITIDNQKEKITVPVIKTWQGDWPENTSVMVGLYQAVGNDAPKPVKVNGTGDLIPYDNDNTTGTPLTVTLTQAAPFNNTAFVRLPSRDSQNRDITYSIKEEKINGQEPPDVGYVPEYGVSSAGVYVVRNKPATSLTVSKEWYYLNGDRVTDNATLSAQSPVTFDVYRSTQPYNTAVDVSNADMTTFVNTLTKVREGLSFDNDNGWSMTIRDLDSRSDLGEPYYYYILETVPSFGDEYYAIGNGAVTIKNKIAPQTAQLTVTKAALVADPRPESVSREFAFTLRLEKNGHVIRHWQVYTDTDPEKNIVTDWNGEAPFSLMPEQSITLTLPVGVNATVTEKKEQEYTVRTNATVQGSSADNGRTFSYDVTEGTDVSVTYTNTLHVICMVEDNTGKEEPFESLKSALAFIRSNQNRFTSPWTIYMLEDYSIPTTDVFTVSTEENITLTTALTEAQDTRPDGNQRFHFTTDRTEDSDRAIITRAGVGGSMLTNTGTLTLKKICLDGGNIAVTADGGLVHSTGTLNLDARATLRNSATNGKGGAVYATGTVNMVPDAAITDSSASSGGAIYLAGGTMNMTGGEISRNTASDGALVTANALTIRINLSGSPVIYGNTNTQSKPANLYIGADSDQILNVINPGLGADAQIGITAMSGHDEIGKQFATAEFDMTAHLGKFINDKYGYHGKLKDGTSINIVWDGLTLKIKKEVADVGRNSNDRFTITLSSNVITRNTYTIDGTLDYSISAARQNRPGLITLRNVKNTDEITISPLPVGNYTVKETASNYTPSYTLTGVGSSIENGSFYAEGDGTVTVTNTRRLANIGLSKALSDTLAGNSAVSFPFTLKLTEADGTAVANFPLTDTLSTDANGTVPVTLSPTNDTPEGCRFQAPVGATLSITEANNPDYQITASAVTMPAEGAGTSITNGDTSGNDGVFVFPVTDDGAQVSFRNERKMAHIELRKELVNKVAETESFTFTITLKKADGSAAAGYTIYQDTMHPENNIVTGTNGNATVTFDFARGVSSRSITLNIPEGTKLEVEETTVKKVINGNQTAIYNTAYSINGGTSVSLSKATINSVTDTDRSIVFTNTRKTQTVKVTNTVNGYSGNVVPFTFTVTVEDGDDYNVNDFTNGVQTFELTTGQNKTLTVPLGAQIKVAETYVVGYETTVKHQNNAAVTGTEDEYVVAENVTVAFTNTQLINLVLENETALDFSDIDVTVGTTGSAYGTIMYRVREDMSGIDPVDFSNHKATVDVDARKTAILEVNHKNDVLFEQAYSVEGDTPEDGYCYTIKNEPSFHEFADPAIMRVYNQGHYKVSGKLRYSVADSTVTFTVQPLVSFDVNGGAWTTEMDGYHDWYGDRRVYQKAVASGETVASPTPAPVYPTAEGISFLGWTANKPFAEASHEAGEDISANAYDFSRPVTAPVTLYAVWAKPAREGRVVTVKNGHNVPQTVTATLSQNNTAIGNYPVTDTLTTGADGKVNFTLSAGESKNLTVPNEAKLVLSLDSESLATSLEYALTASDDSKTFTIDSVNRDGTVTFIPGICKITDSEGNVLYDNTGKPAVYGTLTAAFAAYNGTLYTDASHTTTATPAAVKILVDEYTIEETVPITFPSKAMTLTTASIDDTSFPYLGIQNRSTIYRDAAGADSNCFKMDKGSSNITLTDIILDGGSERGVKISSGISGGLIRVEAGTLSITTGTTMHNCEFADYSNVTFGVGGAIYVKGGTLNVSAGLFSNLHARRGGAICCDNSGKLNITGTGIRFENCDANHSNAEAADSDGGAIYYSNNSVGLTINGGADENNPKPGIVFVSCVARGNTNATGNNKNKSSGGAIYVSTNGNQPVTINGCDFTECSARTTETGNAGNGGGAICGNNVNRLTVSYCKFVSCDTMSRGGAIVVYAKDGSTTTIENSTFDSCNCKGQGGALAIYQPNQEASSPSATVRTTKLAVSGCQFNNCSSGTDNGSGGAIQSYVPCMEFTDSTFTDCWAGKEGGAVNNYFANGYTGKWDGSYMNLTRCHFTSCRAEDRFEVNSVIHYGGAINTKAKTVSVRGSTFTDCVSTLRDGGALHLGGCGSGTTATITDSTFTNCMAKRHGGALFSSAETLTISGSTFSNCASTADLGGAVYHGMNCREENNVKASTGITNCTFDDCSAVVNGGAVWSAARAATIENCTISGCIAESGGAIYLSKNDIQNKLSNRVETGTTSIVVSLPNGALTRATITGGSIENCAAVNGSAVYVGDSATFSSPKGTDGKFTDVALTISDNTCSDINSGAIHGGKLYFEGNVKVEDNTCGADTVNDHDVLMQNNNVTTIYTTSSGLTVDAKIGVYVPDSVFDSRGQYGQAFGTYSSSDYLDAFFNNRDAELFGCQLADNDTNIYWGIYVCKITDQAGNTLTRPNGKPAVYQTLSAALDEFTSVKDGQNLTGNAVYIKMLVPEYHIQQTEAISNFPNADVTLTTASKSDPKNPYRGTEGTFCTISRTDSGNALFSLDNAAAAFRLENITLDGRKDNTTSVGDYRLIEATNGALYINPGTAMQYGKADNGGAVYATGASVTVNQADNTAAKSVRFLNCTATVSGGAIYADTLTILNGGNGKNGTLFKDCAAPTGGAICSNGTTLSVKGATFEDCYAQTGGGAVTHSKETITAQTTITNSAFIADQANTYYYGGTVLSKAGLLNVVDCAFTDCYTHKNGGAVNHSSLEAGDTKTTINNTSFTNCKTIGTDSNFGFGGSVYTEAKEVELQGGSFTDSTASNHGGALFCQNSADGSKATVSGTVFERCSTTLETGGAGGAIWSNGKELTLKGNTEIRDCTAPGYSGAVHMGTANGVLTITDNTLISHCYANQGGAIYLIPGATMNITGSPEFTNNGYTTQNGSVVDAVEGACIYLAEGSRLNLSGAKNTSGEAIPSNPKFSRNILPTKQRITNGGTLDNVRQDIFMAGYASTSDSATNAASIWVAGELTGDVIWVWPEEDPHRLPNKQFAKIPSGTTVSAQTLNHLRNALADSDTHCTYGEYLAGVQISNDFENVYWDKMYTVSFSKIDNKGVAVIGAGFTLYKDMACTEAVATEVSADGETDTGTQGRLLAKGSVEFASIRIGVYYMKETHVPTGYRENNATYLVLVGSPYLSPNDINTALWEGDGPLNVDSAATLVARHTTDAGKYYGIFPLDQNNKAVLRANLASSNVGIENIRNDYQIGFMKVDGNGDALPGAAFTVYSAILNAHGQPDTFEDGYPKLMLWSRDGESYPGPVKSADGTGSYRDVNNNILPKGVVYFRELPVGTYYLLETEYPERNGKNRRAFYKENDRVLKLDIVETDVVGSIIVTLSEWNASEQQYDVLSKDGDYFRVSNREVVCKLTDENNNLLYVQGHKVWENKETETDRYFPAIYETLEEGFDAAQTKRFFYADGTEAALDTLKLKLLKDCTLGAPVNYSSSRKLTVTTAETSQVHDRYVFSTNRTSDTSRAVISRGYNESEHSNNGGALITLSSGASLTLQSISFNGHKLQYNGRAVHVTDGSLNVSSHTLIQNFKATNSNDSDDIKGGAILLEDGTRLTINGGYNRTAVFSSNEVINNRTDGDKTGADGGAIAVGKECDFSITNAQFLYNKASSVTEKKGNGGAVSINKTMEASHQANFPLHNVVFKENIASYNGGAIRTAENCFLTVNNCTFTNNKTTSDGGAIALLSKEDAPSALTITGSTTFTKNSAAGGNGGAVKVGSYGTLTTANGMIMRQNTANQGGAVYVASGGTFTMTGGTVNKNGCTGDGAGIYLAEASVLYLSGNPSFGGPDVYTEKIEENGVTVHNKDDIKGTDGNFVTGTLSGATNGGKDYTKKRQDIFIAGYESADEDATNANSLVVTGSISSGAGSIWVWAEESPHYKTLKQFAKLRLDAGTTLDETQLQSTLEAFRNAKTDSETDNGTLGYLYGELAEDGTNINWNGLKGTARVILKKINQNGAPLSGAKFTVYKKDQSTVVKVQKTGAAPGTKEELKDKISGNSGVFWIGDLPYGTYYFEETEAPAGYSKKWYYFILDENFQMMSAGSSKDAAKTAGEAESTAVGWASKIISGKKTYANLPSDSALKNRVKELLRQSGYGDKVPST